MIYLSVCIILLTLSPFSKAQNECSNILELPESNSITVGNQETICLAFLKYNEFQYLDVEIISEVDLDGLTIETDDGLQDYYQVSEGLTKFGVNAGLKLTRFLVSTSYYQNKLQISTTVNYDNIYPTISIVVIRHEDDVAIDNISATPKTAALERTLQPRFSAFSTASSSSQNSNCSANNTSPEAPYTSDANLHGNMRFMEFLTTELSFPGRLLYFKGKVGNKKVWDFKQYAYKFAPYGNYHYGAVGKALGIPEPVLLRVAGWAQIRAGTSDKTWGHYLGSAPYGDDPADQAWIKKGMEYYNKVYDKLPEWKKKSSSDACNDQNDINVPPPSVGGGSSGVGGSPITPPNIGPIILPPPPPPPPGGPGHKVGDCGVCHRGTIRD